MATNKPRIPVTMEPELFARVTAYRRERGISSQSKAIQQLVRIGLDSLEGGRSSVRVSPAGIDSPERSAAFASRGEQAAFDSPERSAAFAPHGEEAEIASREQSAAFASQEEELLAIARELDPAQKALLVRLLRLAGEREETRRTP